MSSYAPSSVSSPPVKMEVLQWEPEWKKLRQIANAVPAQRDETPIQLARRYAFRADGGAWLAFRKVQLHTSTACLEVRDVETIVSLDTSKDGGYYWNSGPGAASSSRTDGHGALLGGGVSRAVSFAVPIDKEKQTRAHRRWRVPFTDIESVERHLFPKPVELTFKNNGELCNEQENAARRGKDNSGSSSKPSAEGSSSPPMCWSFRLWGPCGLIVSLAGHVDLFLVCASDVAAEELERALLRARRVARSTSAAAGDPRRTATSGLVLSPDRAQASASGSPKWPSRGGSCAAPESPKWSLPNERLYNPSFASLSRPSLVLPQADGSRTLSEGALTTEGGHSPLMLPAARATQRLALPQLHANQMANDGRPAFMTGLSSPSFLCSAVPPSVAGPTTALSGHGTASADVSSMWHPVGLSDSGALVVPSTLPVTNTVPRRLTGTPPTKHTLHVRPSTTNPPAFRKVHWVVGSDAKKSYPTPPFPPQFVYLSKHRTCFLHRVERKWRGDKVRPCVAVDLLQTTIVDQQPAELTFVLEYATLTVNGDDWAQLATVKVVPHPLSLPEQPRAAYVLMMEVLAPSPTVKSEWIRWMTERGAVLCTDTMTSDSHPLSLMSPVSNKTSPVTSRENNDAAGHRAAVSPASPSPPTNEAPTAATATRRASTTTTTGTTTAESIDPLTTSLPTSRSPAEQEHTDGYAADNTPLNHVPSQQLHDTPTSRQDTIDKDAPTRRPEGESKKVSASSASGIPAPASATPHGLSAVTEAFAGGENSSLRDARHTPTKHTPQLYGQVAPLWVSASYSPDSATRGRSTAERGGRPIATVLVGSAADTARRQRMDPPATAGTSVDTPVNLHSPRTASSKDNTVESIWSTGRTAHVAPTSVKLSLLADTSPTASSVDVDSSGHGGAGEAMYDAPEREAVSVLQGEGDMHRTTGVVVERPSVPRKQVEPVPVQVLAPSASLRLRSAPVLPLQERLPAAHAVGHQPQTAVTRLDAVDSPPPRRALPPPTPPADLTRVEDSDVDAVAYRLEQLAATRHCSVSSSGRSPLSPPEEVHRSQLIGDHSVVLSSFGSPGSPRGRVRVGGHTLDAPSNDLASHPLATEAHADHFDSPVHTLHSGTPPSRATASTHSPVSSVMRPPSAGRSPLPGEHGKVLFRARDGPTNSATREGSAALSFGSISPPTSHDSTADVVTAKNSPLLVRTHSDDRSNNAVDDSDVLYCSPDVMASERDSLVTPFRAPSHPPVRMAPLPTPHDDAGSVDGSVDPSPPSQAPFTSIPVAMREFLEDGYQPLRSHRDPLLPTSVPPVTADSPEGAWSSAADRKRAFRESLLVLRKAHERNLS